MLLGSLDVFVIFHGDMRFRPQNAEVCALGRVGVSGAPAGLLRAWRVRVGLYEVVNAVRPSVGCVRASEASFS
ncbi:MAG: hypothetical protein KatS3mg076_1355 [Candidatus Binatia bacterium]|nr:MAG: hypothetical protein KatS3mg076_1355 [Candidatus Binatia bacterium]